MKVIFKDIPYSFIAYQWNCKTCKSRIEAALNEGKITRRHNNEEVQYTCPMCGRTNVFDITRLIESNK